MFNSTNMVCVLARRAFGGVAWRAFKTTVAILMAWLCLLTYFVQGCVVPRIVHKVRRYRRVEARRCPGVAPVGLQPLLRYVIQG